jgi:carbonic anhydrase/acetyltransferase-like protein (isoleucine patch superfamily)
MPTLEFNGKSPKIHPSCYVALNATLIGDVTLGEKSSVWFNAVIRGDVNKITVGARTSIQDNCVLHVTEENPTIIGDDVIMGHGAIAHACTIGNHVLIGMGATILDGAIIGDWVIVAAGAVITEETHVPPKTLVAGVPAKVIKSLDSKHLDRIKLGAEEYLSLSRKYRLIKF